MNDRVTKTFIFSGENTKRIYAVIAINKKDAIETFSGRGLSGKFMYEDRTGNVNPTVCVTSDNAEIAIRERNAILFA